MRLSDDERAVLVYKDVVKQPGAGRLVRELAEGTEWKRLQQLVTYCTSKGFWTQADVKSLVDDTIPALNDHGFTQVRGGDGSSPVGPEMRLRTFGRRIHQLWVDGKIPTAPGGTPEFYDPEEIDRTGYHPTQRWFLELLAEAGGFVDTVPTLLSVPLMKEALTNIFGEVTIPQWIDDGIVEVQGSGKQIRITSKGEALLDKIHEANAE